MFYITGLYRQWSDGTGLTPLPPVIVAPQTGAAAPKKRKRYIIAGRDLELTDAELQQVLSTLLRKQPEELAEPTKPQRPRKRRVTQLREEPKPEQPTFAAVPAFDTLWAQQWVRLQPDVAAELHRIAHEIELARDDEDIELLLLH